MNQLKQDLTKKFLGTTKIAVMSQNIDTLEDHILEAVYTSFRRAIGEPDDGGQDDPDIPDSIYFPVPTEFKNFEYHTTTIEDGGSSFQWSYFMSEAVSMPASAKTLTSNEIHAEISSTFGGEAEIFNDPFEHFVNIDSTSEGDIEDLEFLQNQMEVVFGKGVQVIGGFYFGQGVYFVILKQNGKTKSYCFANMRDPQGMAINYINILEGVVEDPDPNH